MTYFFWACLLGGLSALSLPLGSIIGLQIRFSSNVISILAAFGAGALLAALSVELIAPTTMALIDGSEHGDAKTPFLAMIIGCVAGGILYVLLDKIVSAQGGFLRRTSTLLTHYKKLQREEQESLVDQLSHHELFQYFPEEHIETLLDAFEEVSFKKGDYLLKEGEIPTHTFLITEGKVAAVLNDQVVAELDRNYSLLNLIAFLKNRKNMGSHIAETKVKALKISKLKFDELRTLSPAFDQKCWDMAQERMEQFAKILTTRNTEVLSWAEEAKDALVGTMEFPDPPEMQRLKEEHHGSPIAIWLGILLDGIPESMVIGSGMFIVLSAKLGMQADVEFMDVVPFTLIAGLFLSNFPEALSQFFQYAYSRLEQTEDLPHVAFFNDHYRSGFWCRICLSRYDVAHRNGISRRARCRRDAYHDCSCHDPRSSIYGKREHGWPFYARGIPCRSLV